MWYVYILKCSDDTLYTGITTDLKRRVDQHNSCRGAKYTCIRKPVKLMTFFEVKNRSEATKEELRIKKLTKKQKMELILANKKTL